VSPESEALLEVLEEEEFGWRSRAACRDKPRDWFIAPPRGGYREGQAVCRGCEVRTECLGFALERRITCGLYGGLSPRDRERLARVAC